MSQQRNSCNGTAQLGAEFSRGTGGGGRRICSASEMTGTTAAILVSKESMTNDNTSLNVLIIDRPTSFENVGINVSRKLSSSIIISSLHLATAASGPVNVSLLFQRLREYQPLKAGTYSCQSYNSGRDTWDALGGLTTTNETEITYRCDCNQLGIFALIWSIKTCPANETLSINGSCTSKTNAQVIIHENFLQF